MSKPEYDWEAEARKSAIKAGLFDPSMGYDLNWEKQWIVPLSKIMASIYELGIKDAKETGETNRNAPGTVVMNLRYDEFMAMFRILNKLREYRTGSIEGEGPLETLDYLCEYDREFAKIQEKQ